MQFLYQKIMSFWLIYAKWSFCFFHGFLYSNFTFYIFLMTQFRILATIALLSFTSATFAATVSWEITTRSISNKPVTSVSTVKKPIQKIVVRTYSRTVSYMSPAGKELITFSVKTKNGVIVSASAIPRAKHQISKSLQLSFAKKLSKSVVGKKIKNFDIDAIGWASLTTVAFEQFIKKVI